METSTLEFQNIFYPYREIVLPEFGWVRIATTRLSAKLLDAEYRYVSEEAQNIDEQIIYFVDDSEINLPEKKFRKLLMCEVC